MPTDRRSSTKERTERPSLYKTVTDRIISELREGAAPWVRPWSVLGDPFPRNGLTGRAYQGNNILLLLLAAEDNGYTSNEWFTYLQAKEAGGQVRGGERGTHILKAGRMDSKDKDEQEAPADGKQDQRRRTFVKTYVVFNREQVDGLPEKPKAPSLPETERIARAEAFVRATGATITQHASRAFYAEDLDAVGLPPFERFRSGAHYYATAFHELVHWSGAAHRLDRLPPARRDTPEYAREEMIAEIGAALLCARFGIDGDLRHPAYIASYIANMESDEAAFFRAATAARHAVAYLLDLSGYAPLDAAEEADEADVDQLAEAA